MSLKRIRLELARTPQFHKTLAQVISRHYRDDIFHPASESPSPEAK